MELKDDNYINRAGQKYGGCPPEAFRDAYFWDPWFVACQHAESETCITSISKTIDVEELCTCVVFHLCILSSVSRDGGDPK